MSEYLADEPLPDEELNELAPEEEAEEEYGSDDPPGVPLPPDLEDQNLPEEEEEEAPDA